MNASTPKAYTISDVDAMQADGQPYCTWLRPETKPLTSTSQGGVGLPMLVWSC